MLDLLTRTLSTIEQWLTGQSSQSEQAQRSSDPTPAYVKAVEYDHYIRSNVGGKEGR